MITWIENLRSRLKLKEGLRLKMYKDTKDVWTIGYGLNLQNGLTLDEAEWLLDSRMTTAIGDARAFLSTFDTLGDTRKQALAEMAYNLGLPRLKLFTKFRTALLKGDYAKAASEMEASAWASQVKARAYELADMIRKG